MKKYKETLLNKSEEIKHKLKEEVKEKLRDLSDIVSEETDGKEIFLCKFNISLITQTIIVLLNLWLGHIGILF